MEQGTGAGVKAVHVVDFVKLVSCPVGTCIFAVGDGLENALSFTLLHSGLSHTCLAEWRLPIP